MNRRKDFETVGIVDWLNSRFSLNPNLERELRSCGSNPKKLNKVIDLWETNHGDCHHLRANLNDIIKIRYRLIHGEWKKKGKYEKRHAQKVEMIY